MHQYHQKHNREALSPIGIPFVFLYDEHNLDVQNAFEMQNLVLQISSWDKILLSRSWQHGSFVFFQFKSFRLNIKSSILTAWHLSKISLLFCTHCFEYFVLLLFVKYFFSYVLICNRGLKSGAKFLFILLSSMIINVLR